MDLAKVRANLAGRGLARGCRAQADAALLSIRGVEYLRLAVAVGVVGEARDAHVGVALLHLGKGYKVGQAAQVGGEGAALMAALARAEVVRAGGARACLPGAPANAW